MLLVGGVWARGTRLSAGTAGAAGAALLCVFSPQLVQWSVLASGGYTLVAAWGTLFLLCYDRLRTSPRRGQLLWLGWMAGFGLYIYELFIVYLAPLALGWGLRRWPPRPLPLRPRPPLHARPGAPPRQAEGRGPPLLGVLS